MHGWAEAFPRAARALTRTQLEQLNQRPEKPLHIANSTTVLSSDNAGMLEMFNVKPSASGEYVSPESAMKLSAVYRGTALIAGAVASLPLQIFKLNAETNVREPARDHPLWLLLNEQPTPRFSAATFWEFIVASMLLRGDGFAIILRNRAGVPTELVPIPPDLVQVFRNGNRLGYGVQNLHDDTGKLLGFDQDDVLHFPGFGFNGLRSLSVIAWAAWNSIGTGLAAERYAGRFFANGAAQKFVLTTPGQLDPKQTEQLRTSWDTTYSGAENAHRPLILWGGLTATAISMNAMDAQLLESRRFQVEDIARAFGVPPHMIGATEKTTSWGSGVEHQGIGFRTFTLQPHLVRFQQELNRKLFRITRYFCEFNTDGLLQADSQGTAKYFREGIGGSQGPGWMTINEVRRLKNLPPVDGGDELYKPKGTDNAQTTAAAGGQPGGTEGDQGGTAGK